MVQGRLKGRTILRDDPIMTLRIIIIIDVKIFVFFVIKNGKTNKIFD